MAMATSQLAIVTATTIRVDDLTLAGDITAVDTLTHATDALDYSGNANILTGWQFEWRRC